jgi:hypothetical protein
MSNTTAPFIFTWEEIYGTRVYRPPNAAAAVLVDSDEYKYLLNILNVDDDPEKIRERIAQNNNYCWITKVELNLITNHCSTPPSQQGFNCNIL